MASGNRVEENHAFSNLEEKLFSLLDQMRTKEMEQAEAEGREYHIHGLCAVLGYSPEEHASYFNIPHFNTNVGEDLFREKEIYLQDSEALRILQEAMEIDGAILIGEEGRFMHSGKYMLPNLAIYSQHPEAAATYKNLQETADAGTRHLNAVALSAQLPDLSFYTLKSDHPHLRVFRGGSIVRSTVPGEVESSLPNYREMISETVD